MPVTNTSAIWIHHSNSKNKYKNVSSNAEFMGKKKNEQTFMAENKKKLDVKVKRP